MAKLKTKLLIVAVLGVVLAVFYPKIKAVYGKHVKPHADIAANLLRIIKDFHIFGYHVPWKYVLPGFGLFIAVQLFRVSIFLLFVKRFSLVCRLLISSFDSTQRVLSLLKLNESLKKIIRIYFFSLYQKKSIKGPHTF